MVTQQTINNSIWITWETQRRNKELANAFGCDYLCLDIPDTPKIKRYIKSIYLTYKELKKGYQTIFIQCPSVVLLLSVTLWNLFYGRRIIVDAHNIAIEQATASQSAIQQEITSINFLAKRLLQLLIRFCMRRAFLVIVSNDALKEQLNNLNIKSESLPDKIPHIEITTNNIANSSTLKAVLISSFAKDEPNDILIEAFATANLHIELFVTGRKQKAGDLLKFESNNIHFTDFLPTEEFDALISSADLLVDLTTRDNCLVCGAYEAMAVGVPAILSDSEANRVTFSDSTNLSGFIFAKNTKEELQKALFTFLSNPKDHKNAILKFKPIFENKWNLYFEVIQHQLK